MIITYILVIVYIGYNTCICNVSGYSTNSSNGNVGKDSLITSF